MSIATHTGKVTATVAAFALAGGLLAATANADPRQSQQQRAPHSQTKNGTVVHTLGTNAHARRAVSSTNAYWTPQRMANAKPAVERMSRSDARLLRQPMPKSEQVAPGGVKAAAGSLDNGRYLKRKTYSRRVGKIFYKFNKQNWVCSGAVVNSKHKNLVLTAAHCLWDKKKGWAHHILFVPGFKKPSKTPFGRYVAKRITIRGKFQKWYGHKEDPRQDYGLMKVKNVKKKGPKVAKKVGAFGLQWGRKFRRKFKVTGYPAFHTAGNVQKSCKGRSHLWKRVSRPKRGWGMLKMKCRAVTAGSSGGPWLHHKAVNGQNALVNSFKRPRWVATPWFGRGVKRLYRKFR